MCEKKKQKKQQQRESLNILKAALWFGVKAIPKCTSISLHFRVPFIVLILDFWSKIFNFRSIFNLLKHPLRHLDWGLNSLYSRFSRFFWSSLEQFSKRVHTDAAWNQTGEPGTAVRPEWDPIHLPKHLFSFTAAGGDPWPFYVSIQFTEHILVHYSTPSSQQSNKKLTLLAP